MSDVFGVRVTADLEVLDSLIIICNSASGSTEPSVAFDGQNYVVAYLGGVFGARSADVKVQRVSPQGVVLDAGITLGSGDYHPDIASDLSRCLVVWSQEYSGVKARFVNANGQPEGPVIDIASTLATSTIPAVAFGPEHYLIVWHDFCPAGTDLDIYGQLVSATGSLIGDRIVIADGGANQSYPAVASDPNTCLVVWIEDGLSVCGRSLTAQGTPLGPAFSVSDNGPYEKGLPSTAAGTQQYLVTWNEFHTDFDLFGNLDTPTGVTEYDAEVPVITNRIDHVMEEGTRMYDVLGRAVIGNRINPGIYFLIRKDSAVKKIVLVR